MKKKITILLMAFMMLFSGITFAQKGHHSSNSHPKTVHVRSYTKKNGTHVASYNRSRPTHHYKTTKTKKR